MRRYEFKRKNEIQKVINTLEEAKEKGVELEEEKMLLDIAFDAGVSRRTAKEYLDIAKSQVGRDA